MYSTLIFLTTCFLFIKCSLQESQILDYTVSIRNRKDNITIEHFQLLDKNLKPVKDLPLKGSSTTFFGQFNVNSTTEDEVYWFKVVTKPQGYDQYTVFKRHPGKEDSISQKSKDLAVSVNTRNEDGLGLFLQQSQVLRYEIFRTPVYNHTLPTIEYFQLFDKNLEFVKNLPLVQDMDTFAGHVYIDTEDEILLFKIVSNPQVEDQFITFTRHSGKEDSIDQSVDDLLVSIKTMNMGGFASLNGGELKDLLLQGKLGKNSIMDNGFAVKKV